MGKSEFVGVDGCRSGWFSVGFDSHGRHELKVFPAFSELLDYYREAKLVLVDIPIGLPEGPGGRECDQEARNKIKPPRSASVFSTPTRQTVKQAAESPAAYCCANATEQTVAEKGVSRQAFAIAPKIAEVDRLLRSRDSCATPTVREIHPEVCFWALNKGCAMEFNKKERDGEKHRVGVLEQFEPQTRAIYGEACRRFAGGGVGRDDILDALAAAVTARCGFGRHRAIPKCPPNDAKCLPMEMVYWKP
ncbi:MAG: DUF429 domain-containing protein [Chloroflexi bacterium]|nr:DUF429 domain-containing protein [Chloroflexota bacterium]